MDNLISNNPSLDFVPFTSSPNAPAGPPPTPQDIRWIAGLIFLGKFPFKFINGGGVGMFFIPCAIYTYLSMVAYCKMRKNPTKQWGRVIQVNTL